MVDLAKLRAPFPPDRISWRVGSTTQDKTRGLAFAYIDARDVADRLDDPAVCGPENWQCSYPHATGKTVCRIELRIGDQWIGKEDGAGDTDVEAEKGALSDAFKRAAVRWGIGRYLYDVATPWVEIEQAGKSYKIKDSEKAKLYRALGGGVAQPVERPPLERKVAGSSPAAPTTANGHRAPYRIPVNPTTDGKGADWKEWGTRFWADLHAAGTQIEFEAMVAENVVATSRCATEAPQIHGPLVKRIGELRKTFDPVKKPDGDRLSVANA